jgi:Na+/phosphate symporter
MSEITRGVMEMPYDLAMRSELSRMQFYNIARAAYTRNKLLEARLDDCVEALKLMLAEVNAKELSQEESDRLDNAVEMAQSAIAKATTIQ